MQSFTLNGLNLVINCTEVGKENTEPKPQLMQRGKPSWREALRESCVCRVLDLQIHFLLQMPSWVQLISNVSPMLAVQAKCALLFFLPRFSELSHTNPTWAARDEGPGKQREAQGSAAVQGWQQLLTKSFSLLTMCSWNVCEKGSPAPCRSSILLSYFSQLHLPSQTTSTYYVQAMHYGHK